MIRGIYEELLKTADCPVWRKFLMEIMNYNSELIHFLQKAAGWAVTGDMSVD